MWILVGTQSCIIKSFKLLLQETLDEHYETVLYTLKFHMLDQVVEDLKRLGSIDDLDALRHEVF